MVDRGPLFRRALSWLPAQFASQSDAPVGAPRRFGSTEHLSTEAIAAYVDGELRMKSYLRAAHHLSLCPQCAAEVDGQSQARTALREIKASPVLQRIPIVILTTSKAEEDIVRTYNLGVNSFICKPVTFDSLVEIVKTVGRYWIEIVALPPECQRAVA